MERELLDLKLAQQWSEIANQDQEKCAQLQKESTEKLAEARIKATEASSLATSMAVEIAVTEARQKVVEEFKVCCFFVLFCTVLTDFYSYFIASIDEGGFSCI